MKMMIGGAIAVVLALFGFSAFPMVFFKFLAGIIPISLILAGGLAIYVGRDQVNEADELEIEPHEPEIQPAPEPKAIVEDKTQAPDTHEVIAKGFAGNTDTLVFHSLGCNFSKSKKCTATFSSKEEAQEKGYKPCGVCKP